MRHKWIVMGDPSLLIATNELDLSFLFHATRTARGFRITTLQQLSNTFDFDRAIKKNKAKEKTNSFKL